MSIADDLDKKRHPGGRPKIFKTQEELDKLIVKFWEYVDKNKVPPTIARLGVILGCDRLTILNYEKEEEFFSTIKKAKDKILANKEERLNSANGNKAGVIFDLKNNHKFVDKMEIEQINHTGAGSLEDLDKWNKSKTDEE